MKCGLDRSWRCEEKRARLRFQSRRGFVKKNKREEMMEKRCQQWILKVLREGGDWARFAWASRRGGEAATWKLREALTTAGARCRRLVRLRCFPFLLFCRLLLLSYYMRRCSFAHYYLQC